jgi:hypothetical protein
MGHPAYAYTPQSEHTCRLKRAAMHRHWGNPIGHVQIYGRKVREEYAEPLRYWATWIAWKLGRDEAEQFVRDELASEYRNISWLRDQWLLKRGTSEVREVIRCLREVCYATD